MELPMQQENSQLIINNIRFLSIIAAGFVLSLIGCRAPDRYDPSVNYIPVLRQQPEADLLRIQNLFRILGGNAYFPEDEDEIEWHDYDYFRIFLFNNHSVIIYPYSWGSKDFDLILFAGSVDSSNTLPHDLMPHKIDVNGLTIHSLPDIGMSSDAIDSSNSKVGLSGIYLGQSVLELPAILSDFSQKSDFRIQTQSKVHQRLESVLRATDFTGISALIGHPETERKTYSIHVVAENRKVVYVRLICPASRSHTVGSATLGAGGARLIQGGIILPGTGKGTVPTDNN